MSSGTNKNYDGKAFLGRGWKYPIAFRLSHQTVELSQYEQDIRESLNILLSTELGERGYASGIRHQC